MKSYIKMKQLKKIKNIFPESLKKYIRILKSILGSIIYRFPSRKLIVIGVTGTSGKSTTSNLIYHILEENNLNVGIISTVGAKVGKKNLDTGLHVTTPDPIQMQKLLRYMVKRGAKYVVIETTSHALAQGRLGLMKFDYAVYTNIKRDHLDWHKSWEGYARAKAELINKLKPTGKIVLNRDDKEMYNFLSKFTGSNTFLEKAITYSLNEPVDIIETPQGTHFTLNNNNYKLQILGLYNVENALAAINVSKLLGLSYGQISSALATFKGIEGRMEVVLDKPFLVIVDFAHNTDSLIKSLETAKKLTSYNGKVITVFGSAGLRDVEKRYTMGEASVKYGDIAVVTAEDPRIEKLSDINDQILEGTERAGGKLIRRFANTQEFEEYEVDRDSINRGSVFVFDEESTASRFDAIEFALKIAKSGDVIITQGKGHEQSLCFGTTEYPFRDQEAVKKAINKLAI
jgi:UDP-N-acetylmuramoyl-L-alanyl-D-glutamate--2,6-diaminopimelate ligase